MAKERYADRCSAWGISGLINPVLGVCFLAACGGSKTSTQVDAITETEKVAIKAIIINENASEDQDALPAVFTVSITKQPTKAAVFNVSVLSTKEGRLQDKKSQIAFSPDDWTLPQPVYIEGVDDELTDGAQPIKVTVKASKANEKGFNNKKTGIAGIEVVLTNLDDESPGVTVTPLLGKTKEDATPTTFGLKLNSQPNKPVTVVMNNATPDEVSLPIDKITFQPETWNVEQKVEVIGVDDLIADGSQPFTIEFLEVTSEDAGFKFKWSDVKAAEAKAGATEEEEEDKPDPFIVENIQGTNEDDLDKVGVLFGEPSAKTTEAGGTATLGVKLNSEPTHPVTAAILVEETDEGEADLETLTFTAENWNEEQTITLTGKDDQLADGDQSMFVKLIELTSEDTGYQGFEVEPAEVLNSDDESAGYAIVQTAAVTDEAGAATSFTVALLAEPTHDVILYFGSADTTEAVLDKTELTFTSANWEDLQTVAVTGVDDNVMDGDIVYTVVFQPSKSEDLAFSGTQGDALSFTNTDDDTAGYTVSALSNDTSEDGTTGTFSVVLDSEPTADVDFTVVSSNTAEATVSLAALSFAPGIWNVPQIITVTGIDDDVEDGDVDLDITVSITSDDTNFASLADETVSVTNTDDDVASVWVGDISSTITTEASGTITFDVKLTSEPAGDVTFSMASDDTSEGVVTDPAGKALTFTSGDWSVAQTVTVTGVDDDVIDGTVVYGIDFTVSSTDTAETYHGIAVASLALSTTDDDTAGATINLVDVNTIENAGTSGDTAEIAFELTAEPSSNVTLNFTNGDASEGSLSAATLVFTSGNWDTPQSLIVTGVNDLMVDGDQDFTIATAITSADGDFHGLNLADQTITNADEGDVVGFTLSTTTLSVSENGTQQTFTVVLDSQPLSDVTVPLLNNNTDEISLDQTSLLFTASDWSNAAAHTVEVTGVDDAVIDGDVVTVINLQAALSEDTNYASVVPGAVNVTTTDNDTPTIITSTPSATTVSEAGSSGTFTVVLGSEPSADVDVDILSGDTTEGVVSPASLTFTSSDWNTPQAVVVTGVDDDLTDGTVVFQVSVSNQTGSGDYVGAADPSDIAFSTSDDESTGFVLSSISSASLSESGTVGHFSVVLSSEPTANVTLAVALSDASEGSVAPTGLTFTSGDWDQPQVVTVQGIDDDLLDGNIAFNVQFTNTTASGDYNGVVAPSNIAVTTNDDEAVGISVSAPSTTTLSEAGVSANYTVVLNSEPSANVTIEVDSADTTEGSVSPALLTFTAANWDQVQSVTVQGVDDDIVDGAINFNVEMSNTTGAGDYNGVADPADIAFSTTDDETLGISVSSITSGTLSESGTAGQFSVVLTSKPSATATIAVASDDTSEGVVSPSTLNFTVGSWDQPQIVTVQGVDDDLLDGNINYNVTLTNTTGSGDYSGVADPSDIAMINTDDESVGITVGVVSNATLSESGNAGHFSVVLASEPSANATIAVASADIGEASVNPSLLTFTSGNWNQAQVVSVQGVDDDLVDGDQNYVVTLTNTTASGDYSAVANPSDINFTTTDDESLGIVVGTPSTTTVTETGSAAHFSVVLASEPTANVTIDVDSSDTSEGSVTPGALTFTSGNWNIAQVVTVQGVDDMPPDGDKNFDVEFTNTTASGDYASEADPASITFTTIDDE